MSIIPMIITAAALILVCLPRRKPDHSARMAERAQEYARKYYTERGNWS